MKYKTLFRLLLKLLGLCLLAISIYPLAQSGFHLLSAFVSVSPSYVRSLQYLFYAFSHVVVGLYLFTGGEWIVNWAIPSNRPYCPECAYNLTGNVSGLCPECGTAITAAAHHHDRMYAFDVEP